MRYEDPKLCELLAAEYTLGTLKGGARLRFKGLLRARPSLRRRVSGWEQRLGRFCEGVPAEAPPPDRVWKGIERRLFDTTPAEQPWYRRLTAWRGLSLASTAVAAVLAVVVASGPLVERPAADGFVVVVNDTNTRPMWMLSTTGDRQTLRARNLIPVDMPAGKRCVLWLRPATGERYYAVAALPERGEEWMLDVTPELRSMFPGELVVTIEDGADGLPSAPRGPVEFQGEWIRVTAS